MKVRELIVALQSMPQDAHVQAEGCDCIGDCDQAELQEDGSVLLLRPDDDAPYWRTRPSVPPSAEVRERWRREVEKERSKEDCEPTESDVEMVLRALRSRRP